MHDRTVILFGPHHFAYVSRKITVKKSNPSGCRRIHAPYAFIGKVEEGRAHVHEVEIKVEWFYAAS